TATNDALDEANETVTVDISGVTNGTETGTQQVIVTITDDDAAPAVTLAVSGTPTAENAGIATFTATLSAVSGQAVTVTLGFTGTATVTTDYTRSTTTITIPAGSPSGTATATAVSDSIDEIDESIVVDITAVTNGAETGTQQAVATIVDDDGAPAVTLAVSGTPMAEAGGTATFTATLSAVSSQVVTVTLGFTGTAIDATDYTRSSTSITIPAGSTSGTATATAVNDAVDEANETIVVDITAVTNGTETGVQQRTAEITDDDVPPQEGGGGSWSLLSLWLLLPAWVRSRRNRYAPAR
ncbi:MAG TPA: Calx-beta domain-containing protein, partial [Verrucomicrobiae bacterium]|nr:Calx-beta domain-containing protein [Verrucomicrobiae bacterium]